MNPLFHKSFATTLMERRSIRKLKHDPSITKEQINEAIKLALHSPSAFHMQSSRIIVLTEDINHAYWESVKENEHVARTKITGFQNGNGTVLFYEDNKTIKNMETEYPKYKEWFERCALEGNAMLQYAVWLALTTQHIAASIQHFTTEPKQITIDSNWTLLAQMPFGGADESVEQRVFLPYKERVMWF
ncbi:nitroreductase family protein [Alkalihalobacterium bogoriense]|uniref:nitroreductase family protein n=1 Tax=Alkalihalobacterium bogoriense TaxID=246272 RepID=UPI00047B759A|nr:nitroreductase family protein [Alkalihalobacterium bogoriense]